MKAHWKYSGKRFEILSYVFDKGNIHELRALNRHMTNDFFYKL